MKRSRKGIGFGRHDVAESTAADDTEVVPPWRYRAVLERKLLGGRASVRAAA